MSAAENLQPRSRRATPLRRDLALIAEMIPPGARVLDIGCGDGALLEYLVHELGADGRGIELSQSGVNACVRHGLSVIQGDADHDLAAVGGFLTRDELEQRRLTRAVRPDHTDDAARRQGEGQIFEQ